VKNFNAFIAAFLLFSSIYLLIPILYPPIVDPDTPSFLPNKIPFLKSLLLYGRFQYFKKRAFPFLIASILN